jgi:hypothetical protein
LAGSDLDEAAARRSLRAVHDSVDPAGFSDPLMNMDSASKRSRSLARPSKPAKAPVKKPANK